MNQLNSCRRLLLMVRELHRTGYEQLRICPTVSNSGMHWLCWIAPARYVLPSYGAVLAPPAMAQAAKATKPESAIAALYTSAQQDQFFGWQDAQDVSPVQLAQRFIAHFPNVAADAIGLDPEYALWYQTLLQLTEPAGLPSTYAGSPETSKLLTGHLTVLGESFHREAPLPPPGKWMP